MAGQAQHPFGEYARVAMTLVKHNVEFVICGGIACVFYGVPRNTHDIDVLVRLTDENLARLVEAVRELGLKPRIPEPIEALMNPARRREWIEKKRAVVFTVVSLDSPVQMDIFLEYPIPFDEVYGQARVAIVDGVRFRISSIEHLIRAKQAVQPLRETDEFDIRHLQRMIDHGRT